MAQIPVNNYQAGPQKRIGIYIVWAVVLVVIVAVVIIVAFWQQVTSPHSSDTTTQLFTIEKGEAVNEISLNLLELDLISSTWNFETYVYLDGSETSFIAGTYSLNPSFSIREIVQVLTRGEVSNEDQITIIEGWTSQDIAIYLEEEGVVSSDDFLIVVDVADTASIITDKTYSFLDDKPATAGLEGFLFPDTYRIYSNSDSIDIIERMLDNFDAKVSDDTIEGFEEQGLSVFEAVTLASIVEKEVRTTEDKKIAAGIFLTRIENGIALQSDATVNYVTGKNALQPTSEDLEADSLYNTYQYAGLPPGPIANPSVSSLEAVADPTDTDYLYFLTKPDGTTVFSKTYDEHLSNKRKYLQ
ncbi:endolytic transglycosylase MltG [Patescibacteria group bacterium]